MTARTRPAAALLTIAALAAISLFCARAHAATTVAPLPPSAYTTRAACPTPAPGHATCLALALVAQTAQARAHTHPLGIAAPAPSSAPSPAARDFGLRPQDLHSAYVLPTNASGTQTIALVDAYNDLSAEADLATYSTEFGLPSCTTANDCFTKVNENGETTNLPFPQTQGSLTAGEKLCEGSEPSETTQKREEREQACLAVEEAQGWTVEISLDIETAHAVCQNCHIALVEADSSDYADLESAENAAAELGADEISNSWGGPECTAVGCVSDGSAFDHPGIVITASAGDDGYRNWLEEPRSAAANFPASSPQVVAVGGTRLSPLGAHGEWTGESVWNDGGKSAGHKDGHGAGGGGCSAQFTAQPWQQRVKGWASVGCASKRAVADVAADADPYSGLAVYDSSPECETGYEEENAQHEVVEHFVHWCTIGGTSLASPLIASTFALAGGANGIAYPAQTLYENAAKAPGSLHDVTTGSNGECSTPFDEATGLPSCTSSAEAKASCSSDLICLAGKGYDGPTGVGTPDGLAAFEPSTEAEGEEETSPGTNEKGTREPPGSSGGGLGGAFGGSGSGDPKSGGGASSSAPGSGTNATAAQTAQIGDIALTQKALIALNASHPLLDKLSFAFTINLAAHVRVSLEKRVSRHGHGHWQAVGHALTIFALAGRNGERLNGHSALSRGSYRLTLTPADGPARSLSLKIG
jgi:hypothetical protein